MAGKENVVANCLSRPPDVLSLPRSTKEASIKGPYRSLAVPVAWDGSPGASTVAVVTPGPVLDMVELAHAQESCKETQELRAKLDAQDVLNAHQGPQDLVRQLPGCAEAAFAGQHAVPGIQQHAQPGPPGDMCNQAHADQQVHLDRLLIRCQHLVSEVPAECTCQSLASGLGS